MTDVDAPTWLAARTRLRERGLWGEAASLSLRCMDGRHCWWGAADEAPRRLTFDAVPQRLHAAVYAARPAVGAIALAGGRAACALAASGVPVPQLFDEQARHLGPYATAEGPGEGLARALAARGQWLAIDGMPVCLGSTVQRLVLNLELAEKCATAFLLAWAAGGIIRPLPWWVRRIANGRLRRDGRRAAARFARGLLPEESKGY